MSNPSANFPVSFYWTLPQAEAESSNVLFCPKSGELLALETRTVNISMTPKGLGQWRYLPTCNLNGSPDNPVLLQISCEVVVSLLMSSMEVTFVLTKLHAPV